MSGNKQETFIKKHTPEIREIENLVQKARLMRDEQPSASNDLFEKAFEISESIGFTSGKATCLRELSVNHLMSRQYKSAVKLLVQAINLFREAGDLLTYRKGLMELSDIYYTLGDYEQCLETNLQTLNLSRELNDQTLVAEIFNRTGGVYRMIGEYRKAIEQHIQALKIYEETQNHQQISNTNYHLGNCYNQADELDVAFNYLEKSLKSAQQLRDPVLKINPLGSLGVLFTKGRNYQKAEEYFYKALESVDQTGNLRLKADLLLNFGILFLEQKNYSRAIPLLTEALQVADKFVLKGSAQQIHLNLATAYEKDGNPGQALYHYKRFMEISNEIITDEITVKTNGIQLKFDLEEIRKQKELVEHSARNKDHFLSGLSHELRTPLNGVLGMANLLADTHPSPEQMEYINTIRLSANNLISIIDDILDYSRIKAGEVVFTEEQFNLPRLLTGLAQEIKVKAEQKHLGFFLHIEPMVPSIISGDRMRLSQLLMNLLSNALKFTDKGRITLKVGFRPMEAERGCFIFSVIDTGIGISEDRIPSLFDRFDREIENNGRSAEGTGLGLAIVKQLVDRLKGNISVISKPDEGSVFTVELNYPYSGETYAAGKTGNQVPLPNLADVTLLLVEDNKVNQFLGKQILLKLGFQVQLAGNGREAMDLINKTDFDLILMDVNMPVMNGYELTKLIRNQAVPPKNMIPIVALTAYASATEKEKALQMGMNDYITKPYSPQELLHVIVKQLNRSLPEEQHEESTVAPFPVPAGSVQPDGMIDHLREVMNGNQDDLNKMLEMYLEQIPQINILIDEAVTKRKWEEVYQLAHKLKSSVKLLNISRMSELITMIEEYSKSKENTELVGALFLAFKKECSMVIRIIREYLKKQSQ